MTAPTLAKRGRALMAVACCVIFLSATTPAMAQSDDEELPDARLVGYSTPVTIGGGATGTYLLLVVLAAVSVGLVFKNPNRSHLD